MSARPLVSVDEARRLLAEVCRPVPRVERRPIERLAGRVLAARLNAETDVPGFARAAMDGYAVRAADTAAASAATPLTLRIAGEAWAGHPSAVRLSTGTAVAIATGAVLPDDADAVVMVEDTSRDGDAVLVRSRVEPGQHVSPRGSDLRAGAVALEAGALLTPARVGVVAAIGLREADVFARPRVAVLSSGDEVVPAGGRLGPGQVHDVNTHTLAAIVAAAGGETIARGGVADRLDAVEDAIRSSLGADLVLVSGGSSVGGRDFVLEVLARLGAIRFHGIAVKPGKPTVLAVVEGTPVVGMPGNPTSCLSNGYLFVAPVVRRMAHLPPVEPRLAVLRLGRSVSSPADRHQFYTVRVEGQVARPAFKGSGDITSMAADGYFEIPVGVERVDEGTEVAVTMF